MERVLTAPGRGKGVRVLYSIVVLCLPFFISCGKAPDEPEAIVPARINRDARIRICLQNHNFQSFIPSELHFYNEAQAMSLVFNTLVQANYAGHISPSLASSWEISPDGREYTFHLQRNARFHNGKRLTSNDVIFTLQELIRKDTTREGESCFIVGSNDFFHHRRQSVSGLIWVDDKKFKVLLSRRFNLFLHFLTSKATSIVPANFGGLSRENFRLKPIGTGPFVSTGPPSSTTIKHQQFTRLAFRRNDHYFESPAATSHVEVFLPLIPPRANTLYYFDAFLPPEDFSISTVPQTSHRVITTAHDTIVFLSLNPGLRSGLSNSWRTILQNGIDRHRLIQELGIGKTAIPAHTILPVTLFGHNRYFHLDPARVASVRTSLGLNAKKTLNVVIYPRQISLINKMNEQLNPLGLTLKPQVLPSTRYYAEMGNRKHQAMIIRGVSDYPHAYNFLVQLYTPGGLLNYFRHNNPSIHEMVNKLPTTDIRGQAKLFQELARLCAEDAYYIPLYFLSDHLVLRRNLNPLRFKFGGIIDFHSIEVYHESIDGNH